MRTAYQRGFRLGVSASAEVQRAFDLAWTNNVAVEDYGDCAEEELRAERALVNERLEALMYRRQPADFDQERAAFERIPSHLRDGVQNYLDEHRQAGHFLTAVFMGDLHEALRRADIESRSNLFELCCYLHNYAPGYSYGSRERVQMWLTPTIPQLAVKHFGGPVTIESGRVFCPRCGETHPAHHATVNKGEIKLTVAGESMAQEHALTYVWCGRTRLEVVAIDGKEFE